MTRPSCTYLMLAGIIATVFAAWGVILALGWVLWELSELVYGWVA